MQFLLPIVHCLKKKILKISVQNDEASLIATRILIEG
jgi:hypothetical protein